MCFVESRTETAQEERKRVYQKGLDEGDEMKDWSHNFCRNFKRNTVKVP